MQSIRTDEVQFLQKRQRDDTGRVFVWQDRIFRAIFPHQVVYVRTFFSTGFLDDLISHGYFPNTWITDYEMEEYPLILEHERIWPVLYPQEWTFSMLRDAALMVYNVYVVAKKYGFNMRDCHGLNVLFDATTPKFVDLGSFIPDNCLGWNPYEEFLRFYYYPLKIWQHDNFVGKLSIFSGNLTHHEAYLRYQYPFLRGADPKTLKRFVNLLIESEVWHNRRSRSSAPRKERPLILRPRTMIKALAGKLSPIRHLSLEKVIREIEGMHQDPIDTPWATYHEEVKEKARRFERIVEILNGLGDNLETAVDLGGNQGRFSRLVIERTHIRRIACVDIDEAAVDRGYNREKENGTGRITFANYDFMGGIAKLRFTLPSERFRSDVVFALAITHHLLLKHGYDIDEVFRYISDYARKYVFVEFMPLGLWSTGQEPQVPAWYTQEWFRESFCQFFDLVHEEKLRMNNVLFVGKVCSD